MVANFYVCTGLIFREVFSELRLIGFAISTLEEQLTIVNRNILSRVWMTKSLLFRKDGISGDFK